MLRCFRQGADGCGPDGNCGRDPLHAMFTECCMLRNGEEECEAWEQSQIVFPTRRCDFFGIALAMPTCWDGRIDSPDHKSHMAYTVGGNVADPCPPGYDRRLPQVQLFVRITNYRGGTYVLSDLKDTFHVDFFNGWEEGKLQTIMDTCQPQQQGVNEYNPPCDCTPEALEDEGTYDGGLTPNEPSAQICDADIKRLIVDEDFDQISTLPVYGGSCQGEPMVERTWPTGLTADLFSTDCNNPITTTSTSSTTTVSASKFDCTSMQNCMIVRTNFLVLRTPSNNQEPDHYQGATIHNHDESDSSGHDNKLRHDGSPARGGGSPRHSVRQRRATLEMPRGCRRRRRK